MLPRPQPIRATEAFRGEAEAEDRATAATTAIALGSCCRGGGRDELGAQKLRSVHRPTGADDLVDYVHAAQHGWR